MTRFNDDFMMFTSAHRGFSPPSPQNAVVDELGEETSNAYELGGRYTHGAFSASAKKAIACRIPEYALSFGSGLHFNQWGMDITANYVSETFTRANNTADQLNGLGQPDSRFGKTDEYIVADIAAYYQVTKGIKILGGVQNLADEEYLVSRQPYGPRPGMPIFAYGGFELDFDI